MARKAMPVAALLGAVLAATGNSAAAQEGAGAPGSPWRAPEVVSPGVGVFAPSVALNGSGSAVAAWLPYVTAPRAQAAFRWFGGPWERAENLPAGVRWPASLQMDEAGNVLVHWVANRVLRMSLRPAATGRWSAPRTVASGVNRGKVAIAPNGVLVAAWTRGSGAQRLVQAAVRPAGEAAWTEPRTLAGPGQVGGSDVDIDRTGTALVSWREGRQAWYATRPPGGPFGAPESAPALDPVPPSPRLILGPSGDILALGNVGLDPITAMRPARGSWTPYDPPFRVLDLISVALDGFGNATALGAGIDRRSTPSSSVQHQMLVAHRAAGGPWSDFGLVSESNRWGINGLLAVNPAGSAGVIWNTVRARIGGLSAAVRPSPAAPFGAPETLVAPRAGLGDSGIRIDDAGRALAYWVQDFKLMTSDRGLGRPGAVRLTAGQLRTNQRIAQAAVRSANALTARLAAGLSGADIRNGALGAASFAAGVRTEGRPTGAVVAPGAPGATPSAGGGAGGGRVTLSAAQLLISQRISQAAMRRANAIRALLDTGLTGGNIADGTITAAHLAPGLAVTRAVAGGELPATPLTVPEAPRRPAARVALTQAQLLVNQRISQAAVRRLNALAERLDAGLTAREIRAGTLTAADLAPELRG